MIWLVPSALAITGMALVVLVATHFIARSRPLAEPLPTARFIPERAIRARSRSFSLSDVSLLLLRAAAIAALGSAVAGPVVNFSRGRVVRVIVIDESRAVGDLREVRDSARAIARPGD
ncbi:MAG TPA: BatA domain-containing protein, partial [Gemmatimonadaceae bacterium]|nr:BatA domain-containing protein [Gemmatimonadaceae bacterium]